MRFELLLRRAGDALAGALGAALGAALASSGGESIAYFEDVIDAVAALPDDRSVKALEQYFDKTQGRGMEALQIRAAQGLSRLGTRSSLESIRRLLEKVSELAEAEREMEERARSRGQPPQGGGRGNDGPTARELAQGLHDALKSAAEKAGLSEIPALDAEVARNWKKFLSEHSESFPAKLGKIGETDSGS